MAFINVKVPQPFTDTTNLLQIADISQGMIADWDADSLGSGTVSSWASSVAGGQALASPISGSTAPTVGNGPNGHKAVTFNGSQSISGSSPLLPNGMPGTIIVVAKNDLADNTARLVSSSVDDAGFFYTRFRLSGLQANASRVSGQTTAYTTSRAAAGQWVIGVFRFSSLGVKVDSSLGDKASASGTVPNFSGYPILGMSNSGSETLTGAIARVMVYDRELSDASVDSVMDALRDTYGL